MLWGLAPVMKAVDAGCLRNEFVPSSCSHLRMQHSFNNRCSGRVDAVKRQQQLAGNSTRHPCTIKSICGQCLNTACMMPGVTAPLLICVTWQGIILQHCRTGRMRQAANTITYKALHTASPNCTHL
jgi:hypothetical protein